MGISYGDYEPTERKKREVKKVTLINNLIAKFIVHFRRPSTYNGEFGFDWMRDEYIYPITNVGGINKELSLDLVKLKTEYKTTDVANAISPYGKDYYCTFLNLKLNQEVTMDIEVEELEPLSADATEIIFESSNPELIITPTTILLSTLITGQKQGKSLGGTTTKDYYLASNQVKVKCSKAFANNEQIKVFAKLKDPVSGIEDKKEVGKMMVMKNSEIYKLKARFVEVKFKGKIVTKNVSAGTENTIDFTAGMSVASLPSANIFNSSTLALSSTINSWKSYIENNENDFIEKFNQSLIKYEPYKDIKNKKIDYRSLKVDFKNFNIGTSSGGTGIDRIKKAITSIDIDAIACDMEEFLSGLHEMYANENTEETGITVFLLPIIIRYSNPPAGIGVDYLDGFSDDVFSTGRYIMMTKFSKLLRKETLVHEAAHTLGLFHSFQNISTDHGRPVIPVHSFEYAKTENLMDYSQNVVTFWKWQWKKMREDNIDLELIL